MLQKTKNYNVFRQFVSFCSADSMLMSKAVYY